MITTIEEIKHVGQISTEYTNDEILSELDIVEAELYDKYKLPKRSSFSLDDHYNKFYIAPHDVQEVIRVQVQVDSTVDYSGYIGLGSSLYTFTEGTNYFDVDPSIHTLYPQKIIRVQYIPKLFNRIAAIQTALNLIEGTTIIDGARVETPLALRLKDQLTRLKELLKPRTFTRSSPYEEFDKYDYESVTQSDFR